MSDRVAIMNERRDRAVRHARGRLRAPDLGLRRRLHRHQQPDERHLVASGCVAVSADRLGPGPGAPRARPTATRSASRSGPRRSGSATSPRRCSGCPARSSSTSYHGATTQYLVSIAPDLTLTVLEQNLPRMRAEDRWNPGDRVEIGWLPEHTVVLTMSRARTSSSSAPAWPGCPPRATSRPAERTVTVLEARDRVGGRVEQVELARRPPRPARRRGGGQRPHQLPRPGRGARADPDRVVRRGAGRDHPPGARVGRRRRLAVVVHRRRHRRRTTRSRPRSRRSSPRIDPEDPFGLPRPAPARPAQRRRLAARGRRHARPCCGHGAGAPEPRPTARSSGRACSPTPARCVGGRHQRQLRRRAVGEPAGRRGVRHRGADDGGGARATYACPRRSRSIAVGTQGSVVTTARRRGAARRRGGARRAVRPRAGPRHHGRQRRPG